MIYFLICTTSWPNYRVLFHFYFFSARPFDQKLGSSLIYIFHLHTTIRQNIWLSFSHLFFLCARQFNQKLISSLIYIFGLYMTIRPKLGVALILKFIIKSYSYIFYTIFMELLLLYFVHYIHGVALILRFIIKSYPYISYTIFMEVLLLCFVHYIHGYMKSYPFKSMNLLHLVAIFVIRHLCL